MVTHRMLETLALVARMPAGYRRLRSQVLKAKYEAQLSECSYALDAFKVLLEEKQEAELGHESRACYLSVVDSAELAVRSPVAR